MVKQYFFEENIKNEGRSFLVDKYLPVNILTYVKYCTYVITLNLCCLVFTDKKIKAEDGVFEDWQEISVNRVETYSGCI